MPAFALSVVWFLGFAVLRCVGLIGFLQLDPEASTALNSRRLLNHGQETQGLRNGYSSKLFRSPYEFGRVL